MPPEILPIVAQWGPIALILFGILYRADQATQKMLPVLVDHFKFIGEACDAMKEAVANQTEQTRLLTAMIDRLEEMGAGAQEDHAGIADDAKNACHHARRADDGIQELLIRIPQRIAHEKEVG